MWMSSTKATRLLRAFAVLSGPAVLAACSLLSASDFTELQDAKNDAATIVVVVQPDSSSCVGCKDAAVNSTEDTASPIEDSGTDADPFAPVTVTVQRGDGGSAIDTMLQQGTPDATAGGSDPLQADYGVGTTGESIVVLMKFDLGAIPPGSTVTSASLSLNIVNSTTGGTPFDFYPLTHDWSEAEATWLVSKNGSPWNFPGTRTNDAGTPDRLGTAMLSIKPAVIAKTDFPLETAGLAVVQGWVNNPTQNFGFVIDTKNNSDGILFSSAESANPPQLKITYTPPSK